MGSAREAHGLISVKENYVANKCSQIVDKSLSSWSRLLSFLPWFFILPNHWYWKWNKCLNIKSYKCAQIKQIWEIFGHLKLWMKIQADYLSILCESAQSWNQHKPFQRRNRLYTSESDVWSRQISTYKDGPRTERIEIFIMVVDL